MQSYDYVMLSKGVSVMRLWDERENCMQLGLIFISLASVPKGQAQTL